MAWSDVTLCLPSDLDQYESEIVELYKVKAENFIPIAKRRIASRLAGEFHSIYPYDSSISSDLDRITNPFILKDACIFLTLHLIFENIVAGSADTYNTRKSELYWNKYNIEMKDMGKLLDFYDEDLDLSGQMQGSEKWGTFRLM